jgi:GNAT superfamily N-acetyltransferase
VFELDGQIVGHVSTQHAEHWPGLALTETALGLMRHDLSVVSALFASVEHRRARVGRTLLDHASAAARSEGLTPVLDVGKSLTSAVALYESAGWTRLGDIAFDIQGTQVESWVYAHSAADGN